MKKLILINLLLLIVAINSNAQEIFDAVKANDLTRANALVEKDASVVHTKDGAGNTPLHQAAITGSVSISELLLSKGADINAINTQLNTPLHLAIQNGKDEVAKYLIEKGTDLTIQNIVKKTPLHLTVRHSRKAIAELLIAKGVAIDARDDMGRTPLGLAARETGNVDIAALLISKGADVNVRDVDNWMPLNFAAWKGFKGMIDLLLDHGAEYDASGGRAPQMLQFAAGCGSARLFRMVSERGKDLFSNEETNNVMMRNAIAGGSTEIVNILMAKNIPIKNDANSFGWSPLHFAASNGHLAMIELLVKNGADLNRRTLSGKSVYNVAEDANQIETLKLIKELGGNSSPQQFPELTGPYLGQAPPGNEPKVFARDIVTGQTEGSNHSSISISPDGREIYWQLYSQIWTTKLENSKWTMPEVLPFSKTIKGIYTDDAPFVSPDNKKMFFISTRPIGTEDTRKENIWYVERTSTGWSEPIPINSEVNATQIHWQVSISNKGTLYFAGNKSDGFGGYDIYYSRFIDGKYAEPVNLSSQFNSKVDEFSPFIAPDETYIIYSRLGMEDRGLYISFKGKDGQWVQPIKMPKSLVGVCPMISPDGKYLFIDTRWVSANFIEELRPMARGLLRGTVRRGIQGGHAKRVPPTS